MDATLLTTETRSAGEDVLMADAPDGIVTEFSPGFCDLTVEEQDAKMQLWQSAYDDESAISRPLDLTIGVEIECILLQNKDIVPLQPGSEPEMPLGQEMIHVALSRPMRVKCEQCQKDHDYDLPLNSLMPDREETSIGGRYGKWSVGRDLLDTSTLKSAFQVEFKSIVEHHIEIRSRILHVSESMEADERSDCDERPNVSYRNEVKAVYDRLVEDFQSVNNPAWRLISNRSCGLHVHVGNGVNRRLPLDTVKNVLSLYTANEKAIDNMHSSTRITGSTLITKPLARFGDGEPRDQLLTKADRDSGSLIVDGDNCLPDSASFIHMAYLNRKNPDDYVQYTKQNDDCYPNSCFETDSELLEHATSMNALSWNKIIHKARHLMDLRVLHEPYSKNCAVNLTQLRRRTNEFVLPKQTIEFRQAAEILDHIEALAWVDVLIRLVKYANSKSTDDILAECERIWMDPRHSTLDFLAMLGFGNRERDGARRPEAEMNDVNGVFEHYRYALGLRNHTDDGYASYADECLGRELDLARSLRDAGSGNDFFRQTVIANARMTHAEKSPESVGARLHDKLLAGCYGQYDKAFIDELAYSEDWVYGGLAKELLQERLVDGWRIGGVSLAVPEDEDTAPRVARPTRKRRVIDSDSEEETPICNEDEMDIDSI